MGRIYIGTKNGVRGGTKIECILIFMKLTCGYWNTTFLSLPSSREKSSSVFRYIFENDSSTRKRKVQTAQNRNCSGQLHILLIFDLIDYRYDWVPTSSFPVTD